MIDIEPEIVKACKQKDRKAQMQIYNIFAKRIYNTCYRIVGNGEDAEDTMQEAFIKAYSHLDSYLEGTPFEAWLVKIAINTSIDKVRKKEVEVYAFNEEWTSEYNTDNDDSDWVDIYDKIESVKKAIMELADNDKLIVNLYLMEGYDHEEIAEILNINIGTVRVRYTRAKQRLLTILNSGK